MHIFLFFNSVSHLPVPESADGPVLNLINKRLRIKHNRIIQMEESLAQGKPLNKEQEEAEKNREAENEKEEEKSEAKPANVVESMVGDLLNLLYFGAQFDVNSQNDFTATMLIRTYERGCFLTYDTVTDKATDLLSEKDLDLISSLGGLIVSHPVNTSLISTTKKKLLLENLEINGGAARNNLWVDSMRALESESEGEERKCDSFSHKIKSLVAATAISHQSLQLRRASSCHWR
ncbi:hypothetical protein LINPERPRIM_LOCUS25456 [Linum perenne]